MTRIYESRHQYRRIKAQDGYVAFITWFYCELNTAASWAWTGRGVP